MSSSTSDEIKLDQINFTFEYDKFIKILKNFHLKKFNKEVNLTPQLSGNKLDLLKFYKRVIKLGGFDYINDQKLWAQLAEPLNLPKTCTSRSYMLKQAYIKTLKDFEIEFNGKIPNSSDLEAVKSDIGYQKPIIHDTIRTRQTPGDNYNQVNINNLQSINNNIVNTGHTSIPLGISNQTKNFAPIPPGTQPIQHQPLLIRIYYSLKSNLKNEIEWGLIQLLKFSYFTNLEQLGNLGIIKLILDLILENLSKLTGKSIFEIEDHQIGLNNNNGNGSGVGGGGGGEDFTLDSIDIDNNNNINGYSTQSTELSLMKLNSNEEEELLIYWLLIRNLLENSQLAEYLIDKLIFKDCLNYTIYYCFNSKNSDSTQIQELKLNTLDCLVELSSYWELEEDNNLFNLINNLLSITSDRNIILKSLQIINNWIKLDSNLDIIESKLDISSLFQFSWLFEFDKNLGLMSIELILNYFRQNSNLLLTPNYEIYNLQLSQLAYRLLDTHILVQNQETNTMSIDTDSIIMGWEIIELFLDNSNLIINLSNLKSKLLVKSLLQLSILPTNIQLKFLNYINKV